MPLSGVTPPGRAGEQPMAHLPGPSPPPPPGARRHGARGRSSQGAAGPRPAPVSQATGGSRAPLRRVPPGPFLGAEHRVQAPPIERPIWTGKPEEIRAAVSVPKRAPFDIFDPVILKCMLTETRGELELKAVLIVPDRATFDLTGGSKKAEENSPFPERLMNKVCCADESYVCFARDDEDKLLVYGFETVDTEDTWDAGCSDAGLLTFARGCLKLAEIELLMFAGGCSEVLTDKVEKLCCVDESYIRFARDDEGKLLIYGFETVEVIAATNHADILDPALLCSGRLDRKIEFPHPKEEARTKILQIHSRKMNINPDVNFEELARSTDDFDGAHSRSWHACSTVRRYRDEAVRVKRLDFFLDSVPGKGRVHIVRSYYSSSTAHKPLKRGRDDDCYHLMAHPC